LVGLKKQGGAIKTWKLRWCAADAGYFFYYKNETDPKPQGLFRLLDYQNVERADIKIKKKNSLMIYNKGSADRCYYLLSETSEDDINSWLKALRTEIKFVVDFVEAKSNLTHVTKERPKGPNKRPPTRFIRAGEESGKAAPLSTSKTEKKEVKSDEPKKEESKKEDSKKEEPKKPVPPRPTAAKPKRRSTEESHSPEEINDVSSTPIGSSPMASSLSNISPIDEEPFHDEGADEVRVDVVSIIEEEEDDAEEIREAREDITRLQRAAEEKFEQSRILSETLENNLKMMNEFYKDLKDSIDGQIPPEQLLGKVQKHRDTIIKFMEEIPKLTKQKSDEPATAIEEKKEEVKKEETKDVVVEPKKDEPKKDEPKKDETKKDEPKKDETKKDETKKDESKKDEPKKDEPKKDEPKKDETKKDEPKKRKNLKKVEKKPDIKVIKK